MPHRLDRAHHVHGPHNLKAGKLTFTTASAMLGADAKQAMAAGRDFTVTVSEANGLKDLTGKVQSVELVEKHTWEVVMKVTKESER